MEHQGCVLSEKHTAHFNYMSQVTSCMLDGPLSATVTQDVAELRGG